jgi:hypothetical protein
MYFYDMISTNQNKNFLISQSFYIAHLTFYTNYNLSSCNNEIHIHVYDFITIILLWF